MLAPVGRALDYFSASHSAKLLALFYILISSCYNRARDHYQQEYAQFNRGNRSRDAQAQELIQPLALNCCFGSRSTCSCRSHSKRASDFHRPVLDLEWTDFPPAPLHLDAWRWFTTVWMVYVLFRFCCMQQIGRLIDRHVVELKLPIHCYFVGRFIIEESMAELTGALLAVLHLTWRFTQLIAKPQPLSMVYFLVLSQRDLELFYSKLGSRSQCIKMTLHESSHLNWRERFIYDTMCYRVTYQTKVVFRLRANRNKRALLRERRMAAALFLASTFLALLPIGSLIFALALIQVLLDSRYLRVYPNCDLPLQQLRDERALGAWSMSPTAHHLFSALGDFLENWALWLECGAVCFFAPTLAYLLSYDLVLCWRGIKRKISRLERAARSGDQLQALGAQSSFSRVPSSSGFGFGPHTMSFGGASEKCHLSSRLPSQRTQVYELISEVHDFFEQVARLDIFMSRLLNGCMIGCLGLCAIYTYFLRVQSIEQLPLEVLAIIMCLALALFLTCYGILKVHRSCRNSYTKLCSLMANDRWKREHNFETLIEYYIKKKSCFTLLHQCPFQPTTFLTLIGWTFSCFCIITGMMQRGVGELRL